MTLHLKIVKFSSALPFVNLVRYHMSICVLSRSTVPLIIDLQ